jgi:hypothetical protein
MDAEDKSDLRTIRNWIVGLIVLLMIIGGAATVASRAFDLAWFPWEVKMKTGMIRASNSYITTQQTMLRQFRTDYESATTDGQRAAIVSQMRATADLIPGDVQPDIAAFLSQHGG